MDRVRISMSLVLLVAAFSPTFSQQFREWDRDQDGYITDYEFQVQLMNREYFQSFDYNEDGQIDDMEWEATCRKCEYLKNKYYEKWDTDGDGMVHEEEFIKGVYDEWDNDGDGYIANQEYGAYFTEWELSE